jgi:UDP-glucose 4-epimerase
VLNVCTGIATSVEALANLIANLAGRNLNAQTAPARAGEIRHSLGAPTHANAVLALSGRVPLRTGLAHILAWMAGSAD